MRAIANLKSDLDRLKSEYDRDKMELTYYSVKEKVIDFIERLSVENKRAELIKIIRGCQLFASYLLIGAGKLLFVFNVKNDYKLPEEAYEAFKNDTDFKRNFLNSGTPGNEKHQSDIREPSDMPKDLLERLQRNEVRMRELDAENKLLDWHIVRFMGELKIREYPLDKPENRTAMERTLEKAGIDYSLKDISKVVSFTDDI